MSFVAAGIWKDKYIKVQARGPASGLWKVGDEIEVGGVKNEPVACRIVFVQVKPNSIGATLYVEPIE